MNHFNNILDPDKGEIGKTGPFDFWMRSHAADMARDDNEREYVQQRIQQEIDFVIGKKLSAHLTAVTKDGKEVAIKIYWHPPKEGYEPGYMPYKLKIYRVTGYALLTNPEEAGIGDYAQLERNEQMIVGTPYEGMAARGMLWRVGRHIFEQVYFDNVRLYKCTKLLPTRPYEGMRFEDFQEPKEADVTWRDPAKNYLPSGKHTLPPGEKPLP